MISKRVRLYFKKCYTRVYIKEVTFNDLGRYRPEGRGGGEGVIVLAFLLAAKINMRETVRDASFRNVGSDLEIPIPSSK